MRLSGSPSGEYFVWRSIVFGGLSMMSKETGITVFLLNLGLDFYKNFPNIRRALMELRWNRRTQEFTNRTILVLIFMSLLILVRLALLQGSLPKFSHQDNPAAFHSSLYVRISTFCYLAAFNWWLLLCPATLSHDWQMGSVPLLTSIYDSRNLVTFLLFGLYIFLIVRSLYDFDEQKHTPIILGLWLLVLPFLPATNLFITVGFVVAERVLYIPSLGCILLVIYAIEMMWYSYTKHRQIIMCFAILLLMTSCIRTIIRNRDWRSRESLLRAGLMTLPHNAKMHYNYANFLRDSARPELAKAHYHKALKLWPTYASAHNNLGTVLSNEQEAEHHFLAAIRYSSDHVNAHYNLGRLYRKTNQTFKSELMLRKCIQIEPTFSPAYLELARLQGPKDMRVGNLLRQVMELNRKDPYFGTIYGQWLLNKGNILMAREVYWKVLQSSASYQEAMLKISRILRKTGQKSRLFQVITRWHAIIRQHMGEVPWSPHIYLQGWYLKTELNSKAKVYDNCTIFGTQCIPLSSDVNISSNGHKWSHLQKYKTNNSIRISFLAKAECKPEKNRIQKQGLLTPMMVHHLLDSV